LDFDDGLFQIEDQSLARALLEKVNDFNVSTGIKALAVAVTFGALPQTITAPMAFSAALAVGLYFLKDKLPKEA
jgi:hypothetical protein